MKKLTRRDAIKIASATAGGLFISPAMARATHHAVSDPRKFQVTAINRDDNQSRVVQSVCLGCNGRCGIRFSVANGTIQKASGNPYHPYNHHAEPCDYATPVQQTIEQPSPVCAKAQDVSNYVYNPYRILKPLKRSGPRGSGKFRPISWQEMIDEISAGGQIFSDLGENRHVKGLKALDSDQPANSNNPSLGSLRNSFVFMSGRMQSGRKEFIDRFVKDSFGSQNRVGHTDICGIGFRMGNYTLTESKQVELKADPWSAKFILVFGANIYEALQPGLNAYGATVAKRSSLGKTKFTIVDPRAQNAATHAENWLPIKPGQDGALAMGMIRWIIENKRHNRRFLTAPNAASAKKVGHSSFTNASHLIIDDPNHPRNGYFLRQSDLSGNEKQDDADHYVVLSAATQQTASAEQCSQAILEAAQNITTVQGASIYVTTSFSLMKKSAFEYSLDQYASFSGLSRQQIEQTALDFTSYGTQSAVCLYHGAGNYSNGTYASYPITLLNVLIGSIDQRGGYLKGGGGCGKWNQGPYTLDDFPGKRKRTGPKISREKYAYEKTAEYREKKQRTGSGYPAQRPWFPYSKGGLSVEALSGIDQGYPYACNMLMTYFYNPIYSTPGGYRFLDTLTDEKKVPLHISIDIAVNESNLYADYIVPDVTYTEGQYGWLTPHAPALKFTGLRSPCIEPITGKTSDGRPFSLETFLIDLAEAAQLPGYGDKAIAGPDGTMLPFHCAEDFYLRAYSNLTTGAKVPAASAEEVAFVEKNYPAAKHKATLRPQDWKVLCYALARGGIFTPYEESFDGNQFKHSVGRSVLYNETLATTRNSLTGQQMPGTIRYMPPTFSNGEIVAEVDRDYPFTVITFKMNVHTQSRTSWHKWSMEIFPENYIAIHPKQAKKLQLADREEVKLVSRSRTDGILGKVVITETIRPDCLGISFHYGHTQLGASRLAVSDAASVFAGGDSVTDKQGLIPDPSLGTGINPNMVSRLDENLGNTPLVDVLTGIPDFSSTQVKIVKVGGSLG